MKKFFAVPAVVGIAAIGLAACGGSTQSPATKTVTVPVAKAARAQPVAPAQTAPTAAAPAPATTPVPAPAHAQVFNGTGQQNLGTINVPTDSTISWNCPTCGNTNFIINNAQSDANMITTNGLDQTQGVDTLPAGTYHTVVVDTAGGPWTVAIGTTAPPPPASGSASANTTPTVSDAGTSQSSSNGSLTSCDQNISVNSVTSCPFADNVFKSYWQNYQANGPQASAVVSASSPVTNKPYTMTCTSDGNTVTCTGGNDALVTFPISAVQAY
jgi:hypothetical protein